MGKAKNLTVLMNGVPVGQLTRRANGIISFGYDEDWLSDRNRRPLSLSLTSHNPGLFWVTGLKIILTTCCRTT